MNGDGVTLCIKPKNDQRVIADNHSPNLGSPSHRPALESGMQTLLSEEPDGGNTDRSIDHRRSSKMRAF